MKPLEQDGARLSFRMNSASSSRVLSRTPLLGALTVPASIADFSCFMINVIGEGISTEPGDLELVTTGLAKGREGNQCTYFGATSPVLKVDSGSVEAELTVPKGPDRLIQLFGLVFDGVECPAGQRLRQRADFTGLGEGELYELSRTTVDVEGDISVGLENLYDPDSPKSMVECFNAAPTSPTIEDPVTPPAGPTDRILPLVAGYTYEDSFSGPTYITPRMTLPATVFDALTLLNLSDPTVGDYIYHSSPMTTYYASLELYFELPGTVQLTDYSRIVLDLDLASGMVTNNSGTCVAQVSNAPVTGGAYSVSTRATGLWQSARGGVASGITHVNYEIVGADLTGNFIVPSAGSVYTERMFPVLVRSGIPATSSDCSAVALMSARVVLVQ